MPTDNANEQDYKTIKAAERVEIGEVKSALTKLENAISIMDLNASIADEDVKYWNDVINAATTLKKVIEND